MFIEQRAVGELMLYPEPGSSSFQVEAQPLLVHLRDWLSETVFTRLESAQKLGKLSDQDLRVAGLVATFDERKLELQIAVPPEVKKTNVVFLSERGIVPGSGEALDPAGLSGFVNFRMGQDFNSGQSQERLNGRRAIRSDIEGAVNLHSWVLEALGSFTENRDLAPGTPPLTRGDVRLVRDDPGNMVRYSAGDLSYPITGFQRYRPLGGITVARNFSLQPYRVTLPMSNTELFLKSPSRVVVWVNGYRIQTLYLASGRHDLRNLVLGNGINDVRLEITDDVGRTEVQTFSLVPDAELLAPGLHQFSYSAGVPYTTVDGRREYNSKLFTGSLFHRVGLSNYTTLGLSWQNDHRQLLGGAEFLHSTKLGTFGLEPAVSRINDAGRSSYAMRLRYLYTDYRGPENSQRSFGIRVENRGPQFSQFDDLVPEVVQSYDLGITYGQMAWLGIAARLSADYQFNRKISPSIVDGYGASLNLTRGWSNGVQLSLTLSDRKTQNNMLEKGAFVLLSWAIPETNHYLSATEDTARDAQRIDWRYNSPQMAGGVNTAIGVERAQKSLRVDGSADYTANRFSAGLSHAAQRSNEGKIAQTTNVRAGSSFVFADGAFGIGRPILDSFAIVKPVKQVKGETIEVNPNGQEYYEARTDWLGSAVVPNMRSYQYFRLYFDPSRLKPGLDLGRENYTLLPSYKSGYLIEVGADSTVMLVGTLIGPDGKALGLQSGEARLIGDPAAAPVTVFTNRKGVFQMEGFKPGQYEMALFDESWAPFRIEIPEKQEGVYNVGVLRVKKLR